jgi:hypothetical protein
MSAVSKELIMFPTTSDIYIEDSPPKIIGESIRPPLPYAQLIKNGIESSDSKKMTLSSIYAYVIEQYPYFKNAAPGWKVKIINLEFNQAQSVIEQEFCSCSSTCQRKRKRCILGN